jgi:hypothetical protein
MGSSRNTYLMAAAALIVLGILALIGGIIYLTTAGSNLPSFMGHVAHMKAKRTRRGDVGIVVAVVLLIAGVVAGVQGSRQPRA